MKKSIGKFVLTAAAILAITMFLWSCGNSSNNNNGGPTADASGSIVLPSGFALNPSSLHVTSASGTVTVGSNGSYTVTEPAGGGAATVLLTDANDNVVMLGHVDTDNTSFNEISPTSTAVEILFLATGSFTLPQTTWPDVYRILAAASETATLAGVISTQMAANPTAVGDMDPVIVNAIEAAVASLLPGTNTQSSVAAASRSVRANAALPVTRRAKAAANNTGGLQVGTTASATTPNPGWGMQAGPSDDHRGIVLTNLSRINRYYFLYRTGYIPSTGSVKDGPITAVSPWEIVSSGFLPAVSGTSGGVFKSLIDVFSEKGLGTPEDTPIQLSLSPGGAVANTYQLYVVGSGSHFINDPPDLKDNTDAGAIQRKKNEMILYQTLKEFIWPMLTKVLPLKTKFDTWKDVDKVVAIGGDFIKAAGPAATSWLEQITKDPSSAWPSSKTLLKAIVGVQTPAGKALVAMLNKLSAGEPLKENTFAKFSGYTKKLFQVIQVVDGILAAGDIGYIGYQTANSNTYNIWDVSAAAATVALSPPSATLTNSKQTAPFFVKVTGYLPNKLNYFWGPSTYGTFTTACRSGNYVDCFGSQTATYSLNDNTSLPGVPSDTFPVKVQNSDGITIGTFTGIVYFSHVVITPYTNGQTFPEGAHLTFAVSLASGGVPTGTNVTWSITAGGRTSGTINGGTSPVTSTSVTVNYVAPMVPATDLLEVQLIKDNILLGRSSVLIEVGSGLISISPDSPVSLGAQQAFTVSGANGFVLPASATYRWTVKGNGTLSGGNPTTTTTPTVTYTAPNAITVDTLTVQVTDQNNGNIVAEGSLDINVGMVVWKGTSNSVTNETTFPIYGTSQVEVKEYPVDSTHVYYKGTSIDNQSDGTHGSNTFNCGTASAPATVTSNGDGTDSIAIPSGCPITTEKGCTATVPYVTLTRSSTQLFLPEATYTWSKDCNNATTKAYPFTLYQQ